MDNEISPSDSQESLEAVSEAVTTNKRRKNKIVHLRQYDSDDPNIKVIFRIPIPDDARRYVLVRMMVKMDKPNWMSYCSYFFPEECDRPAYKVAVVSFEIGNYGVGTVTHELTHALFSYYRHMGKDCISIKEEEDFSSKIDGLVSRFWELHYGMEEDGK